MSHSTTFLPLCAGFPDLMGHHRHLLDDGVRTRAFCRALAEVVRPGHAVADLGAGTGVLSIAARRAGARIVYAIERGPIVHVARAIAERNGVDGIVWIEGDARSVVLPEPVDVIVSECFGPMAVGGTMIDAVAQLRDRHLAKNGTVLPGAVTLWLAPVEAPRAHAYVTGWATPRYGVDWSEAARLSSHNVYNTTFPVGALLAEPGSLATLDLSVDRFDGNLSATLAFECARAGTLHGFAGWFDAQLSPRTRLPTGPGKRSTIWRQVFFPLPEPLEVTPGLKVSVTFACTRAVTPGHVLYFDWRGDVGGAPFAQSTRYSFPDGRAA